MMTFRNRRLKNGIIFILTFIFLNGLALYYGSPVYQVQVWSGWILFSLIILLFLYSIRKKITFLSIGKASHWLQLHNYIGLLAVIIFFKHISYQLPTGIFESILGLLFITTALSGILGLLISRTIPKQLTRRGEELIYERIPFFSFQLKEQAQNLVLECTLQTNSSTLADYYQNHLALFFFKPKINFFHVYGSMEYLHVLHKRHLNFCRYLNAEELSYATQLFELTKKKYDLDFHYVLQSLLKTWVFIHLPLTFALLIFIPVHLILVYAFIGPL